MDGPEPGRGARAALVAALAGFAVAAPAPAAPGPGASGGLADGTLRTTVTRLARGDRPPAGVDVTAGGRVRVEALLRPGSLAAVERRVETMGGRVEGHAGEALVQALVPADRLETLERSGDVRFLRPPLSVSEPVRDAPGDATQAVAGQELAKTNAASWHAAGYAGDGIRVGIVDGFDGPSWQAAQAAGEVPPPAGQFCRADGALCDDVFDGGSDHGVAVAEVISEMAPRASLYLASADTASDLQAAVDYFAANGVRIVSRSLTAEYDGRGDGTGPIADVIDNAVARGMAWLNSAGNSAGRGTQRGSYWRGGWTDANGNGFLDWAPGDELLQFDCSFVNGLRWSDWGAGRTDYDLLIFDDPGATVLKASGTARQSAGAPPLEHVNAALGCRAGDVDYAAVKLFSPGAGGTAGDVLEFMTNGAGVEHWQNPFSATGPAADSASPGEISVGAIDPALGVTIGDYSSEGPMNDGRLKPDVSAASCVSSFTFAPCFNGTSAATPVVAGAAALVLQRGLATTPAALKSWVLANAVVDRGPAGPDEVYGAGELVLPAVMPAAGSTTPPAGPAASGPPADRQRPTVRVLVAHGRRGKTARLAYRVLDNSGEARQTVVVVRGSRRLKTIRTGFGRADGRRRSVRWHVPKRTRSRRLRFCVKAADRAGNTSANRCARLTIRR